MRDAWSPTHPTVEEIERGRAAFTQQTRNSDRVLIGAHVSPLTTDKASEAETSVEFLNEQTGDGLSQIKECMIVGDAKIAYERITRYVDTRVSYFVFRPPHTKNSLDGAAGVVSQL